MKKRNSFFFPSTTKKATKKRNKHKAKQKNRSVSGVSSSDSIADDDSLNDKTTNRADQMSLDSTEPYGITDHGANIEQGNNDFLRAEEAAGEQRVSSNEEEEHILYRRLDFKQHVDIEKLRQQSVSPCAQLSVDEERNKVVEKKAFNNLFSPAIDGPEMLQQNNSDETSSPRKEQRDLVRASSKNPTATLELDMDCNVKYLSKSWETFVGTKVKKIAHKPVSKIIIGDENDKNVFQRAIEIMSQDNASYRVRFIVAKNHIDQSQLYTSDTEDDNGSNRSTNTVDASEEKSESSSQHTEEDDINDVTIGEENVNSPPSTISVNSESVSDLSTNDELIELEGQGILIHDIKTNKVTHSMWLLRPYIEHHFLIELPNALTEILGFGAELFANFLKAVSDAGISDESMVPPPNQLFCNICEREVPSWWLERHSEICYAEYKAESDLQIAHDNLLEHKNLISSIAALTVYDYKDLRLPISAESPPFKASTIPNRSLPNALRFPFRTLHSLSELCEQSLNIDPLDFESDDEKAKPENQSRPKNKDKFKESVEKEFSEIFEWRIPKSNDKAINVLIEDTELLAKQKAEAVLRVVNTQSYHDRLKKEVDILVLSTVRETVSRVNQHLHGITNAYSPIIAAASTSSPDLIYNYMDKEATPTMESGRNVFESYGASSRPPSISSPLRRDNSFVSMQRQASSSSIVSDRKSYYMDSEHIAESLKGISLLDSGKNDSVSSLKKSKEIYQPVPTSGPIAVNTSPRRAYSPSPIVNSPLTSIQRNNRSQNNLFLQNNDSSTATSSPILVGGDESVRNVFLDFPRKDSDDSGQYHSGPSNLNLSQHSTGSISKPPLSPLLISSFQGSKSSGPSIKDYEILKPISKGAFGSVYLARKKLNGEYYAVKVLKKSDMVAKNQVTNVKAERAIMMAQSDSPFVAKLFSTFQTRNYLFLVMEYLNGGDCASLLKVLGTLPENWTKRYIAEIVVSVEDLHGKGIVHRDLKPDNFLIDSRGHLKLTDFGLSRMGLVGRQFRHQKGGNSNNNNNNNNSSVNTPDTETFSFFGSATTKRNSSIIPMINDHKRSTSYASSISSSDSSGNLLVPSQQNSTTSVANTPTDPRSNNYNSPTAAWFENLIKQEKSNSSLTGSSPRSKTLNLGAVSADNTTDATASPVVKPLHSSNSQASFTLLDDEISLNHPTPKSLALFNPQSSADARKFVGTPDYLAPEIIKGLGQDESSDWWSLGCILFEFLFGYPPFHASTISQVFENILSGEIGWPEISEEDLKELCSKEAKDLIEKLLTVDREKRLGYNGSTEITNHTFFNGIQWDKLWDEEATFIPNLDNPESTDYFDPRGASLDEAVFEKDTSVMDISTDKPLQGLANEEHTYQNDIDKWLSNNQNNDDERIESSEPITATVLPHSSAGVSDSQPLQSPSTLKRERRKSIRLNESSSEFGSFQYRNLTALEKENKNVINRLKSEHLDQKNSISSSSSSVDSGTRSRGFSFSSNYTNSPYSSKGAPASAGAAMGAAASSPNRTNGPTIPPHSHSFSTHTSSPYLKHERMSSSLNSANTQAGLEEAVASSRGSSGRASPISTLHNNSGKGSMSLEPMSSSLGSSEFAVPTVNPKSINKFTQSTLGSQHNQQVKPVNKSMIYGKSLVDFSPSSSDNEESRNSAILRIKRRRSTRMGSGNSSPSYTTPATAPVPSAALTVTSGNTVENDKPRFKSLDILLCESIPIFRFSVKKLLEKMGCNVVAVGSGDEIIRRASGQVKFDLIFTTLKAQKLHINDIIKLIRYTNTINSGTPIVALTSFYKEAQALKLFDDVIEKPATATKLESVLTKFCAIKDDFTSDAESVASGTKNTRLAQRWD